MEVPSGSMDDQITEKVKKARRNRIMKLQHAISTELNANMVGQEIDVLIESFDESKKHFIGRSQWDAPGIDNTVYVRESLTGDPVYMGEVNKVLVEEAKPYDLFGVAGGATPDNMAEAAARKLKAVKPKFLAVVSEVPEPQLT
jgi:ribosomal protein S12 methylthiotransferase